MFSTCPLKAAVFAVTEKPVVTGKTVLHRGELAVKFRIAGIIGALIAVIAVGVVGGILAVQGRVTGIIGALYTVITVGVIGGELAIEIRVTGIIGAADTVIAETVVGNILAVQDRIAGIIGTIHSIITERIVWNILTNAVNAGVSGTGDAVITVRVNLAGLADEQTAGNYFSIINRRPGWNLRDDGEIDGRIPRGSTLQGKGTYDQVPVPVGCGAAEISHYIENAPRHGTGTGVRFKDENTGKRIPGTGTSFAPVSQAPFTAHIGDPGN